ncbi:hypothetical protein Goarm_000583 [Gossypium armourianum]|uniref:Photosystem I n=1 Tax=Gossypium armourianum TaxID=34283 RepID=A0A7J9KA92_9ROSI|nr:hypothetical protein [Gossypium armourianum]
MLDHKEAIISHLSWANLFLGFHTFGLYVHNDVMLAFGTLEKQILIEPIFAQWIQSAYGKTSYGFDVLLSSMNGPAFYAGLHTITLILVKGTLDARSSKLMPDKKDFSYSFPCDGPGQGGTCDISTWDAFYSLSGMAILAHSILMVIPNYFMQSMVILKGLYEEIERMVRFLGTYMGYLVVFQNLCHEGTSCSHAKLSRCCIVGKGNMSHLTGARQMTHEERSFERSNSALVRRIHQTLSWFKQWSIRHISREENSEADHLVKLVQHRTFDLRLFETSLLEGFA